MKGSEILDYIVEYGEDGRDITFEFDHGLWIYGTKVRKGFTITDMYYGDQENRPPDVPKGYGTNALSVIRELYPQLYVAEVTEVAIPFWDKMVDRGIVRKIVSYWDEEPED